MTKDYHKLKNNTYENTNLVKKKCLENVVKDIFFLVKYLNEVMFFSKSQFKIYLWYCVKIRNSCTLVRTINRELEII